MRPLTALGLLITITACGKDSTGPVEYALPVTPAATAVCATFTPMSRALVNQSSLPGWLDIFARLVPGGYAGYDATRAKPTLLLVDVTQFASAKANIGALLSCPDFPPTLGFTLPTDAVAAAHYDFTRLYAWDRLLEAALATTKGVTNRQFDLGHNQIVVTVADAAAASAVRILARKAGVPDDALAIPVIAR